MMRKIINNALQLFLLVSLCACTGTKHLPPGEKLYTGAEVELLTIDKIENQKKIIAAAKSVIKPKPNKTFLGMRPKLWIYNLSQKTKKKKIKAWLEKRGEPPVLMSSIVPSETVKYIDAALFNRGIFKSATEFKVIESRKHTAKVLYLCHVHKPYTIQEVTYNIDNEPLKQVIASVKNRTLLKEGIDYNLDVLKQERERIDAVLKNHGYYYFNADYLLFKADTSAVNRSVSLQLTLKNDTPPLAVNTYKINHTYIDPAYSLRRDADSIKKDTLKFDEVYFLNKNTRIRPKIILQSVYLKKNDLYSREKHNITLNRLMTLGTFRFVRMRFVLADTANNGLDMHILLTPTPKRTLRAETNLISKSNNFVGPELNINYRNRNALNGAELLNITVGGSFETQFSGKYKNLYSYSIDPRIELYVPRFVVPFRLKNESSFFVPKTKFSVGYNYLKRIGYFDMTSFQFIYGYKWKEDIKKEHELNPLNVNYTSVSNKTPEFNELLNANPYIKKSYEEQFIAGATYSFTFNEQVVPNQKNQFYFNIAAETSGNLFSAFNTITGKKPTAESPATIVGSVYSQYAKMNFDARNYLNFNGSKLVLRLYAGIARPYGNSSTLPYIKQYFSGGPNSVRAFRINSLGPGTSEPSNQNNVFVQQGGDVKLESNVEYRFDIYKFIKGATFIDAGNTWLLKYNAAAASLPFSFSRFYKEVAVGAGIGLRIDVSFFVLRFDLAMPLRQPWIMDENSRWVINKIDFGNYGWRSENLILNVAIGYPF